MITDKMTSTTKGITEQNRKKILRALLVDWLIIVISSVIFYFLLKKYLIKNRALESQARTDDLTQLPNRKCFFIEAEKYLIDPYISDFIVAFLDIDFFKSINDTYGHEAGDKLLIDFTEKVSSLISKKDYFARLGGDEFVLLIQTTNITQAKKTISSISHSLNTTYSIKDKKVFVSTSLGIVFYPRNGISINNLLIKADEAMYFAKKSGRGTFKIYSKKMHDKKLANDEKVQLLRSIIRNNNSMNNLFLEYQPFLGCANHDSIIECEALLRWKDNNGTMISPDIFIPLSEESNLIDDINFFVIDEVCKQQKIWQGQSELESIRVNINISGDKQIFKKLLTRLKLNLKKHALNPKLFGIEITERTLFDVSESTITELKTIRRMGIKISIDDFGTGYSSLNYLNKLPITTLKIDKSFIDKLPEDKYNTNIVNSVIALGHSLGLEIVAEGVETQEQLTFLSNKSCDYIQGYFYSKPLSSNTITAFLKKDNCSITSNNPTTIGENKNCRIIN